MYYVTYAMQPDWPANTPTGETEWNRTLNEKLLLPCAKTGLGTRLRASYIMASSTTRYKIVASTYTAMHSNAQQCTAMHLL